MLVLPVRPKLTEDMLRHVLPLADHVTHAQLRFGIGTGARIPEIENLRWSEVDLIRRRVWFEHPMTLNGGRSVPLPPKVLSMLWDIKNWWGGDAAGFVWAEACGIGKLPLRTRWRRLFTEWSEAHERGDTPVPPPASFPAVQELRRFAIQLLLDRGVPPEEVAAWSGRHVAVGEWPE